MDITYTTSQVIGRYLKKLEALQQCAALAMTSAIRDSSSKKLYHGLGFESGTDRR